MGGGHGQTNLLQDLKLGKFDHVSQSCSPAQVNLHIYFRLFRWSIYYVSLFDVYLTAMHFAEYQVGAHSIGHCMKFESPP